ncbi:phosphoheptose isomerase [Spirochaetia bacterium]|nr:phosphoheptose isomerase [Spirochaetia bacterium]
MNYTEFIISYIQKEIEVLNKIDIQVINRTINLLMETYEAEKSIYIFGNGGSSATASHYTNDFNKGISEHTEKKFNFICLNDNVPTLMAIANDIGFGEIFRFQLKGHLKAGDIVIGISGSGNSINVINAVNYAREQGNKIIGITGYNGGKLGMLSDLHLNVPVNSMQITEDIHMIFDHLMMSVFYKNLADKNHLS